MAESMTYLQAMALSRGGQLGEAGGLSGLEGNRWEWRVLSSFCTVMLWRKSAKRRFKIKKVYCQVMSTGNLHIVAYIVHTYILSHTVNICIQSAKYHWIQFFGFAQLLYTFTLFFYQLRVDIIDQVELLWSPRKVTHLPPVWDLSLPLA